jgi:glycosyltransferase involved in cell wall biosynthesis
MAHALPVIVSKADGTEADLVRQENGWLIEPGDIGALAQRIDDALSNPRRLREMGAASYRIVSSEINIENMSAAFVRGMGIIASKPLRKH